MNWLKHQASWPHATHSSFHNVRPHRWHVQDMGEGPLMLLLHGAGASTQSFRALMPLLAASHRVLAVDLPGHGFTVSGARSRASLDCIAEDMRALLRHIGVRPKVIVGHSAGAAVATRMALDMHTPPDALIAINGAFEMFDGMAGWLFPMMAKMLSLNPLTGMIFSVTAGNEARVRKLLQSTGSEVDAEGIRLYHALISDRSHVEGTLSMMAQWRLERLLRDLPKVPCPTLLLTGENDGAVPPSVSEAAAARIPTATHITYANRGHLLHEEDPETVADRILSFLADNKKGSQATA
ncbi:hypothetical protein PM03_13335 [Thalassobacter stenotrophicus]|uniref:alpha/beta fold hydrolase BchO n=1 Tax=Thalassobacter TaxID=266808 RepID=UPI00051D8F2F|nr:MULTISPECIES: alpha/beta fold hydrolase BchO [Thalassobacter]KGK78587.1 hypothetical protein PM03_13335 [Thalassobacter stenotrophicus]KGL00681.1 magnesium chelatase [Thalassobacter sp. 16PALIMAR09]